MDVLVAWAAPLAIGDAPLALLAVAGLLLGVFVMARGAAAAAPPAGHDAAPSPPASAPLGAGTAGPAADAGPEPEPAPAPAQLPRTTFRQGRIRVGGLERGRRHDDPPPGAH